MGPFLVSTGVDPGTKMLTNQDEVGLNIEFSSAAGTLDLVFSRELVSTMVEVFAKAKARFEELDDSLE